MSEYNEAPIIGVLAQEMAFALEPFYPGMYTSYIAASYVKFLEGCGARVVPIWIGKPKEYYEDILMKINGVMFPGGATYFDQPGGFAEAGEQIYKLAQKLNDGGDYFPLWGTCLGFELLTYLSADQREHRTEVEFRSDPLNLIFKKDFKSSKLFGTAPDEVISILKSQNVTTNAHRFCITEENLSNMNLEKEWRVLTTNDLESFQYISSIESRRYPFYGVQFHPEKNLYEWVPKNKIIHTKDAIIANRYFADFFVEECRKNQHCFNDIIAEKQSLIYNFEVTYCGLHKSNYQQCYFFV